MQEWVPINKCDIGTPDIYRFSEVDGLSSRPPGSWFKVMVSVTDSDDPKTYWSRCISRVSTDTQNKMIKIFKNY